MKYIFRTTLFLFALCMMYVLFLNKISMFNYFITENNLYYPYSKDLEFENQGVEYYLFQLKRNTIAYKSIRKSIKHLKPPNYLLYERIEESHYEVIFMDINKCEVTRFKYGKEQNIHLKKDDCDKVSGISDDLLKSQFVSSKNGSDKMFHPSVLFVKVENNGLSKSFEYLGTPGVISLFRFCADLSCDPDFICKMIKGEANNEDTNYTYINNLEVCTHLNTACFIQECQNEENRNLQLCINQINAHIREDVIKSINCDERRLIYNLMTTILSNTKD